MEEVHRLARTQHGLVTRGQLMAKGVARGTIDGWARRGRLRRVRQGVFALPGSAPSEEQRLLGAILGAGEGGLASHRAAGWLWGLVDELTLEVSVPRERRPRMADVVVHRPVDLHLVRRSRVRGIPTTDPLRTLVDVGAVVDRAEVAEALERALSRRLVTARGLHSELLRSGGSGHSGAGVLRRLLTERALGDRPADSVVEGSMASLLRGHCLPRPVYQHVVRVESRFVARVDFAYPEHLLALEVDGHEHHRTAGALQRDLTRQNELVAAGWTVLRFTWLDVVRRPGEVAAAVRRQLARLGATA